MQKKLVQSSLAMAAAAALGLGGAFAAAPASADQVKSEMSAQAASQAAKKIAVVNAFGFDEVTKTLSLGVESADEVDSKQIEELKNKYGADSVKVTAGVPEGQAYAGNDAVGGMGYLVDDDSGSEQPAGACSTGFAGWDKATKKPIVLSAGHCAEEIFSDPDDPEHPDTGKHLGWTTVRDAEKPSTAPGAGNGGEGFQDKGIGSLGEWKYKKFGTLAQPGETTGNDGDIDLSVIDLDTTKYGVKAGATDWTSASSDDLSTKVKPIASVGSHTDGAIEKSGRTTGLTNGEVIPKEQANFDFMVISGRWVHGFAVKSPVDNPFSEPGDSGGGVFQGDTAVGVISGGSPKTTFVDEEGNPVGDPFALGWVADLDYALDAADVDITFEDPNEEPPGEDDKDADANAEADAGAEADGGSAAEGAEAEKDGSAGADGEDADASAAAEGDDANASDNADADAKEADASSAAEGDDAEASADADGAEADASAAAGGKDDEADSDADGNEKPVQPDFNKTTVEEGGTITGTAEPNAEVQLTWNSADANAGSSQVDSQAVPAKGSTTVKTDAKGNFSFEAPAEAGVYNYTAVTHASGQSSAPAEFTVTVTERKTEAPAERKLTVEPKEIAASDFVQQDKGVQITAEGFEEGEEVTLKVVNGPEGVKDYQMTETAKADGVVGFSIYGTSASNPEAYLGKYDLEVTGANDTEDESALTGSFQVVADEDGTGGGNDDGNGDGGGSDLPRTGAELTGLAAGAGLLLVGGAAVVLTMRRKKNN